MGGPTDGNGAERPRPTIVITFHGPDSAECDVTADHVTPGQRMVAARLLDHWDREARMTEQTVAAIRPGGLVMPHPAAVPRRA